jgi:hypothetical protein
MTANDWPVVTGKGHEHGNTAQSGGLKLMTGVGPSACAGDPDLVRQGNCVIGRRLLWSSARPKFSLKNWTRD